MTHIFFLSLLCLPVVMRRDPSMCVNDTVQWDCQGLNGGPPSLMLFIDTARSVVDIATADAPPQTTFRFDERDSGSW